MFEVEDRIEEVLVDGRVLMMYPKGTGRDEWTIQVKNPDGTNELYGTFARHTAEGIFESTMKEALFDNE